MSCVFDLLAASELNTLKNFYLSTHASDSLYLYLRELLKFVFQGDRYGLEVQLSGKEFTWLTHATRLSVQHSSTHIR